MGSDHSTRLLVVRIAIAMAVVGLVVALLTVGDGQGRIRRALETIRDLGTAGHAAYFGCVLLVVPLMIPNSWFELGGGILFPVWLASVYVIAAETLGSCLAFVIARFFFSDSLRARLRRRRLFDLTSRVLTHEGWRTVALTRVMPMFPFKLSNYVYGLTDIRLRDFAVGTLAGIIPRCILFVYLGSLIGDLADLGRSGGERSPAEWAVLIAGLLITLAGMVILANIGRRVVRQKMAEPSPAGPGG